jgi:hypothetical protein
MRNRQTRSMDMRWNRAARAPQSFEGRLDPVLDRPVFAADRRWRQRFVSAGLGLGGALLLGWLVALVAGALGFGRLPALPFAGGGSETASGLESRSQSIGPEHGAVGQGSKAPRPLSRARPGSGAGQPPTAAKHTSAAGRGEAGPVAPAAVGHISPAGAGAPHSAGNVDSATSAPAGAGNGSPAGNGGGAVTGAGAGASASTPSSTAARGAPAVTPSGREVPSGSGPSNEHGAAGEAGLGMAQSKTAVTPG